MLSPSIFFCVFFFFFRVERWNREFKKCVTFKVLQRLIHLVSKLVAWVADETRCTYTLNACKPSPTHGLDYENARNAYQKSQQQKLWKRALHWKAVRVDEGRKHLVKEIPLEGTGECVLHMYLSSKTPSTLNAIANLGEPVGTCTQVPFAEMNLPCLDEDVTKWSRKVSAACRRQFKISSVYAPTAGTHKEGVKEVDAKEDDEVEEVEAEEELEDSDAYASSDDDEVGEEECVVRCVVVVFTGGVVIGDCKEYLERGGCSHAVCSAGVTCPPAFNKTRVDTRKAGRGGTVGKSLEYGVLCARCKGVYTASDRQQKKYHVQNQCKEYKKRGKVSKPYGSGKGKQNTPQPRKKQKTTTTSTPSSPSVPQQQSLLDILKKVNLEDRLPILDNSDITLEFLEGLTDEDWTLMYTTNGLGISLTFPVFLKLKNAIKKSE